MFIALCIQKMCSVCKLYRYKSEHEIDLFDCAVSWNVQYRKYVRWLFNIPSEKIDEIFHMLSHACCQILLVFSSPLHRSHRILRIYLAHYQTVSFLATYKLSNPLLSYTFATSFKLQLDRQTTSHHFSCLISLSIPLLHFSSLSSAMILRSA